MSTSVFLSWVHSQVPSLTASLAHCLCSYSCGDYNKSDNKGSSPLFSEACCLYLLLTLEHKLPMCHFRYAVPIRVSPAATSQGDSKFFCFCPHIPIIVPCFFTHTHPPKKVTNSYNAQFLPIPFIMPGILWWPLLSFVVTSFVLRNKRHPGKAT